MLVGNRVVTMNSEKTDQHGGDALHRLENTRAGPLVPYWRAAAYDDHSARTVNEWAKLAFRMLAFAVVWLALDVGAALIAWQYPGLVPTEGTIEYEVWNIAAQTHHAVFLVWITFSVMYVAKTAARVVEDEMEDTA